MSKSRIARKLIKIEKLLVNPNNKRYINEVYSEIDAIIEMFNVKSGKPYIEMLNLATDIATNDLHLFENPIAWYDKEQKKYVVIEGNRRVSCIKLMTQYRNNENLKKTIPSIVNFWKLNYNKKNIECVIYDNYDDANAVLPTIHQNLNGGIGRKEWGAHEKHKYNAEIGDLSKTYSIIKFVKKQATPELIKQMDSTQWTSKLERVLSFTDFKTNFNITFDSNNNLEFKDTEKQVYKMLEKLVTDLINKPASGNIRTKTEFKKYCEELSDEYKTQIKNKQINDRPKEELKKAHKKRNLNKENNIALTLSVNYSDEELQCLTEKGKTIIRELETLNIYEYPYSAASLCRLIIEFTSNLWITALNVKKENDYLPTLCRLVVAKLQEKNMLGSDRHEVLVYLLNKAKFIENLNFWMHKDELLCVKPEDLKNGWIAARILIEVYIKFKNNIK